MKYIHFKHLAPRAQVSIWIILSVILLLVFLYLLIPASPSRPTQISQTTTAVEAQTTAQQILSTCADTILHEGILNLGMQSGYIYPPDPILKIGDLSVPYHSDRFPTLETSRKELERFMNQQLSRCRQKYLLLARQGWKFTPGTITAQVTMGKTVTAVISDTTKVTSRETSWQVPQVTAVVDLPYDHVQEFMEQIHSFHKEVPGAIPISAVAEYASQSDVIYFIYELSPEDIVYEFEFPFSVDQTPYRFLYILKVKT